MTEEEKCEIIPREVKQQYCQSNSLEKMFKPRNNIPAASFQLSHTIAQCENPLSDDDYLEEFYKLIGIIT